MSITVFRTCRIDKIKNNNNLNNFLNYTHSTKEVIQLINFLKGNLKIPIPYNNLCFRTGINNWCYINYNYEYTKLFLNTDIFIIEICSKKLYIHNDYYLHHLCVDKRFQESHKNTPSEILKNHTVKIQSDDEIENDIINIQKLLYPKKIIIISHYNSKKDNELMYDRNHLICLLDNICNKHNIPFINPTEVLSNYTQEEVMTSDLGHFTDFGLNIFNDYINDYIDNL